MDGFLSGNGSCCNWRYLWFSSFWYQWIKHFLNHSIERFFFFFPSTAKTECANRALILVWQRGGWVCSQLKWAHELFSSLSPCCRAVGHEGRAEGFVVRSVQLQHHCTNCRAGVLSSLEEYREKRSVSWQKAQSRLRKHNFFWVFLYVVFFHRFATWTSFSVSKFCGFKVWLIMKVCFFTVVKFNFCLGGTAWQWSCFTRRD